MVPGDAPLPDAVTSAERLAQARAQEEESHHLRQEVHQLLAQTQAHEAQAAHVLVKTQAHEQVARLVGPIRITE